MWIYIKVVNVYFTVQTSLYEQNNLQVNVIESENRKKIFSEKNNLQKIFLKLIFIWKHSLNVILSFLIEYVGLIDAQPDKKF